MSTSELEDALRSVELWRRNDAAFVRYLLETKLPAADDEENDAIVGSPSSRELENSCVSEPNVFHSKALEYLEKQGPFLLTDLKDVEESCYVLLNIADSLKVLTPPDEALPFDIMDMVKWKDSLCELIKELKTVEEQCASLIALNPNTVYVLTTSPYHAFLRALTAEIIDTAEKIST